MQFFWQDFIYENISSFPDSSRSLSLAHYMLDLKCKTSCFAAGFWVHFLSSLQDCNIESVQSNTSLASVWKVIAHNRHNTGRQIAIYWYSMCHMTKNASSFSQSTLQQRFQMYPLWRVFSKSSVLLDKNTASVWTESPNGEKKMRF